jgi:hypothetical protein
VGGWWGEGGARWHSSNTMIPGIVTQQQSPGVTGRGGGAATWSQTKGRGVYSGMGRGRDEEEGRIDGTVPTQSQTMTPLRGWRKCVWGGGEGEGSDE